MKVAILSEHSDATHGFRLTIQSYSASPSIASASGATIVTCASGNLEKCQIGTVIQNSAKAYFSFAELFLSSHGPGVA